MYSKEIIDRIDHPDSFGSPEHHQITQELVSKLLREESLSLFENNYACKAISLLNNEDGERAYDLHDYPLCTDYHFTTTYLTYYSNLNGYKEARNQFGIISLDQKIKDIAFIDSQYTYWKGIISRANHSDITLNYLSNEVSHHIRKIEEYSRKIKKGYFAIEYDKKSIILHSRYIYLMIKQYYEALGNNEQIIIHCNKSILIDSFAFIHILFRHYASILKEYQRDKSYHSDQIINHYNLPHEIILIIKDYFQNIPCHKFDGRKIYFKLRGQLYALWFRPFSRYARGSVKEDFLRLQTFYPVQEINELGRIEVMEEVISSSSFSFFTQTDASL